MNFIIGLSLSEDYNVIWVVVDRLIKERYYVLCITEKNNTFVDSTMKMLIKKVFRLYELSTSIVFDRDSQFVVTVWKSFYKRLDIQIKLFTIFHFKTNEQIEWSN